MTCQLLILYSAVTCLGYLSPIAIAAYNASPLKALLLDVHSGCVGGGGTGATSSQTVQLLRCPETGNQTTTLGLGAAVTILDGVNAGDELDLVVALNNSHHLLEELDARFPQATAQTPHNIVMVIIDSVPAREFVDHVPEEWKRTSKEFRERVANVTAQFHCGLLEHHYAGSSYTHDAMYTLLHSVPPLIYTDDVYPWSVPIQAMREAGFKTAIFQNGDIGYDYCSSRTLKDGGGTLQFETTEVLSSDSDVTKEALAWIGQRGKDGSPFFLVLYYESTHMLYGTRKYVDFEDSMKQTFSAIRKLVHKLRSLDLDNTILMITADHGSAVSGVDDDCNEFCEGHGYGTFGNHATDQVAHIPLWICPPLVRNGEEVSPASLMLAAGHQLPVTSSADIMPTLLASIGLDLFSPTRFWSTGRSWLPRTADDASPEPSVFSLSRLRCRQDIATITRSQVRYHTSKVGCFPWQNASECERASKVVTYPGWSSPPSLAALSRKGGSMHDPSAVIDFNLGIPTRNRAALPYPPSPSAFLLGVPHRDRKGGLLCVKLGEGAEMSPPRISIDLQTCPTTFNVGDADLLPFLWKIGPLSQVFHAIHPVKLMGQWMGHHDAHNLQSQGLGNLQEFSVRLDADADSKLVVCRPWIV